MYYFKQTKDGVIVSVESKSVNVASPDFGEATKDEYDNYIASLPPPPPPEPIRDLDAEIDKIEARIEKLEPGIPPRSTHISTIDAIDTKKARPVRVKRVWEGKDYFYDCLVTESVKDQYLAGDVKVGDYVIVHLDDIGELVVTNIIFNSW